jgi:prepilin-type N-terminal cleavage/methylation domain-containing protein
VNTGGKCARSFNWQLITNNWQLSSAFTLAELLVVMAIMALMLALAVPALKILGGGADIASAENQMAAILGRARAQAISDQTVAGVMFFVDPADSKIKAAIVEESPSAVQTQMQTEYGGSLAAGSISLDLATDTMQTDNGFGGNPVSDFFYMPPGIGIQFLQSCAVSGTPAVRTTDGYIGFNTYNVFNSDAVPTTVEYGGVILFNADGRLVAVHSLFHTADSATIPKYYTKLGELLFDKTQYDTPPSSADFISPSWSVDSQYGLVVFDHNAFLAKGFSDKDPLVENNSNYTTAWTPHGETTSYPPEQAEETWLDENATPLIIDRYDGSLIRGE